MLSSFDRELNFYTYLCERITVTNDKKWNKIWKTRRINEYSSKSIRQRIDIRNTFKIGTLLNKGAHALCGRRVDSPIPFYEGTTRISSEAIDHRYQIQLSYCVSSGPRVCLTCQRDYSAAFSIERMECGVINQRPVLKRIGLINAFTSCTRIVTKSCLRL